MATENIDYDDLKKRGFLRQKQEGFFLFRTRMTSGVYNKKQLDRIGEIAKDFGRGFVHMTVRQGIEIPFIKFEEISEVEALLKAVGVDNGTSGARLRATTVCPGNNWCKSGLINTFALSERLENQLGIKCGLELPHKFKINSSGCPNTCTRAQQSEIGVHGAVDLASSDKRIGYTVYLGGCGGRAPSNAFKLNKIFNEDEVLSIIEKVVNFFKANAKPKQRLALLIEEAGREKFLMEIGLGGIA
jgi:dissimilatory sulfite reductase (desulfoviridin) alpha/beta subunit